LLRRLVAIERLNEGLGRAAAIMAARDAIYEGDIARAIAAFMRAAGGAITADDLREQRVEIGAPTHTAYRGIDVYACGPWSQGPLVPMTLNLLEGFDIASFGPGSLAFLHRYVEAFKLAAADREGFFGDPDQVDVPIRGLLNKDYADRRRELIREDRAYPELPAPGDPWSYEGRSGPAGYRPPIAAGVGAPDTSFACAMDAEGNAFAATPSDPGLGAPLVGGLGIIVSTRGAQLWTTAGHPSAIAPRKRPRLTPNPALLMKDGRPLMPFGCPGEDAQCQAMVQVVCNIVDFGMNTDSIATARAVDGRARAELACRIPDHRSPDLPQQLLADAFAPPRPGARRAFCARVDGVGRPSLVRPLDHRVRGSSGRHRADPRRCERRGRHRAERLRGARRHREHAGLRQAAEGDRVRPRLPDRRARVPRRKGPWCAGRVRAEPGPGARPTGALRANDRRAHGGGVHGTGLFHDWLGPGRRRARGALPPEGSAARR